MIADDERIEDDPDGEGVDDNEVDEFADDDEVVSEELEEFDGDGGEDEDIDVEVALSAKEQSARSLEIRREIENRREQRHLQEDIDYLDYDLDD